MGARTGLELELEPDPELSNKLDVEDDTDPCPEAALCVARLLKLAILASGLMDPAGAGDRGGLERLGEEAVDWSCAMGTSVIVAEEAVVMGEEGTTPGANFVPEITTLLTGKVSASMTLCKVCQDRDQKKKNNE